MLSNTWHKLSSAWRAAQDFGWRWTIARVYYELHLRTGLHRRRFPMRAWQTDELQRWLKDGISTDQIPPTWREQQPAFFFDIKNKEAIATAIDQVSPQAAERLADIDIRRPVYFTKLRYEVDFPAAWFTNPFRQPPVTIDAQQHWSTYPMYSEEYEDLKFIWEYGRFSIVYDLVRSYVLNDNQQAPQDYWYLVESWIDNNPPNTGPHWKCGQETSLRLMAWYFGLFAFLDAPETTADRFEKILAAIAVQADRVSKDLQYSYLQHSNHAVSEGLGLYLTGLLFPQLRSAEQWRAQGKAMLEERAQFLIRPDGTPLQKSHNYLRFILHAYLYAVALGEANGDSFAQAFKERLQAALTYLRAVSDPISGQAPNYGSNDGALILPLNACDFTDYRPVIAALHYYLHRELLFEPGPWHEDLIWLFGPEVAKQANVGSQDKSQQQAIPNSEATIFETGGIYTLRDQHSWIFMHAESFTDRPAHADALHLDLWWKGRNLISDPGTYLYYGHPPWLDAFKHSRVHSTVTVDGKDQMERTYRFTWAYWHKCKLVDRWQSGQVRGIVLEHDGYHRLADPVTHRRSVISLGDDCWMVVDDLLGRAAHQIALHWLLPDFPYSGQALSEQNAAAPGWNCQLQLPEGKYEVGVFCNTTNICEFNLYKGDPSQGIMGLKARYYGLLETALSLQLTGADVLPLRLVSCFGPAGWSIERDAQLRQIHWQTPVSRIALQLGAVDDQYQQITTLNNYRSYEN